MSKIEPAVTTQPRPSSSVSKASCEYLSFTVNFYKDKIIFSID